MLKHTEITQTRIQKSLPRIEALIYGEPAPVEIAAWHVGGEPVAPEYALQQKYAPFAVGEVWGPDWDTSWFRVRGQVPAGWAGCEVHLLFSLSDSGREGFTAEGLVYREGKLIRAVNRARRDIEVSPKAQAKEEFEFYIEGAANISKEDGSFIPPNAGPRFRLAQAEIRCFNREAFDYFFDFQVAADAAQALPADSQRRAELLYALNTSLNIFREDDPATIPPARGALEDVLSRRNGPTHHKMTAVGNAHIDTAWLWPLRETVRKCARTFSTAVDYMERYPEYIFSHSQPQQFVWIKVFYPELYEKVREYVRKGQFEVVGSFWIEMDCNLAGGESLIRQILYGKQFFQQEFGVDTRDAWLPDVFGYSAALPQIFRGCGIDYFLTQKICWNQLNKFPHHTFLWEGIDGSRIFTHFPPADTYIGAVVPKELAYGTQNFKEHGRATESLYLYGHGDGGGGPDIPMLERLRRLRDFEGLPTLEPGRVAEFFPRAVQEARDLPVWVGELYLELHRGTYTTQAKTKLGNRKCELLLREAEFNDAVSAALIPQRREDAATPDRAVYDVTGLGSDEDSSYRVALERAWKLLLLNQFHDIIPGSSINWVYQDAARDYSTITQLAKSVLDGARGQLDAQIDTTGMERPVRIANSLSWRRNEVVELPDGSLRQVDVPPAGYQVIDAANFTEPVNRVTSEAACDEFILENGILHVRIGHDGLIESIWDLELGREVLASGAKGNLLQLHEDRPNSWDAWDIDPFYKESCVDLREIESLELVESGPLRAIVAVTRVFGKSRVEQQIVLKAGSRRLDFITRVDWQEDHKLLKAAFPVNIHSARASYEIQFGHTERPTHYNTSWDLARFEVCAHRWADLSEAGYGVALLNDCKYGYDLHGNVLRLSLLRAPSAPDPVADRGTHQFTYSLYPHSGDLRVGSVIEEAFQLNAPLTIAELPVERAGTLPTAVSHFQVSRPGVIMDTIKRPEDGEGIIVRLYEAYGSRGNFSFRSTLPIKRATVTNMLEEHTRDLDRGDDGGWQVTIKPFEIVTLRLSLI
jgi:alpha-mannosidase